VTTTPPELSIIVPVLNEVEILPALFATLARQKDIRFELLLCDGSSGDGSRQLAQQLSAAAPFPCRLLLSERGRARQLNAGARAAAAPLLLFLHADSGFPDPLALRHAVDALLAQGDRLVAGHFALRFALPPERYHFGYFLAESKARLDLPGCTHGDQGFLLTHAVFRQVGPFDERLPIMEDSRLAEEIRGRGGWLLLPAEIVTSARRFETEGLLERQLLNALLMNFAAIGWGDFFAAAPTIYRCQKLTARLQLEPFFTLIARLLKALPRRQRWAIWYQTGGYVRSNGWQLFFGWEARQVFRKGQGPEAVASGRLLRFRRWFDRLTDHPLGQMASMALVWCWFQGMRLRLRSGGSGRKTITGRS
jgi:rSAM/selenodomain-associated transferase 2